jgi:CRP-like cAMP-binding protein
MNINQNSQLFKLLNRKLNLFLPFNEDEKKEITNIIKTKKIIPGKETLIRQDEGRPIIYILEKGWAYEYQIMPDGKRQIIDFILPGSFIGLKTGIFGINGYAISTINECIVNKIFLEDWTNTIKKMPKLLEVISWILARKTAMISEHIVSLGRRDAYEALCYLFLQLYDRLKLIKLTKAKSFDIPISQEIIADFSGMTVVHVNRTLKKMEEEKIIIYNKDAIKILDIDKLKRLSQQGTNCIDESTAPASTKNIF